MRLTERNVPAAVPEPSGDALVWPSPVSDADILWLDPEPALQAEPKPDNRGTAVLRPESPGGISLAQLLAASVPIEWHDAVAIVSQLADGVLAETRRPPTGAVPAIGAIRLHPDGQVHATLEPNGSEPLPAGFGRVLQALLQDKPTPANLRLLVWRTTSGAGGSLTLDEITGELARWERPGRVGKLKDLYERARAAGLPRAVTSFPPRAEFSTAAIAEPPATRIPESSPGVTPESVRRIALLVAAAIVCVAVGSLGAWLFVRLGGGAEAPAPRGASRSALARHDANQSAPDRRDRQSALGTPRAPVAQAGRGRIEDGGPALKPEQRTQSGASSDVAQSLRLPTRATRADAASTPPSLGDNSVATSAARVIVPHPPVPVANSVAPVAVPQPAVPVAAPDVQLYKSGDAGVTEPVLVKPYLPPRPHPPIPDSALGVLEVVVDARGRVESVHLKSPANRYREKWWLFTAKDWQFEPARKNGTPVRFLKRILLTDLNISEPQ